MTQPIDLDVNPCAETLSADLKQSMHRAQSAHWPVFNFQVMPCALLAIRGQGKHHSGMIPNRVPGRSRTGFRFQAEAGTAFGFPGMISTGR